MTSHQHPLQSEVRSALARLLNSETLRNSDRTKEFVSYVVEETLAGRAAQIRGKTIAADVFGRNPAETDSDNVVRVEARRVRRKLQDYYRQEGIGDPLRIHVDAGGYEPRFEVVQGAEPAPVLASRSVISRIRPVHWGVLILAAVGIGVWVFGLSNAGRQVTPNVEAPMKPERLALREKSLATLQAANLDLQGRNLLFPILDAKRQRLAASLFEQAIELDPGFFGSYASAAHSYGTLALLSPDGQEKQDLQDAATEMAKQAVELAPKEAWAQAGNAWAHFSSGQHEAAIRLANLAIELDPNDGNVLDTFGMIMLTTGHFQAAANASAPDRRRDHTGRRLAHRNIYGVSSFHLGEFDNAIAAFETAIEQGDPVSAPTLVFMAASYEGKGELPKARALLAELKRTYPGFDPSAVFSGFYRNPEHASAVLEALERIDGLPDK